MLKAFESNILKNGLFKKGDKLLLAISGGVDSVVLAHLLKTSGYTFSLAHCNFQLRAGDSELDEKFCKSLAKKLKVPIHTKKFDTKRYCDQNMCSVQLAARKLRYDWFHELINDHHFDHVLTAHHANDMMETILINLVRGTGISGLKGIPDKNGKIARPLLIFKKTDIEAYAKIEKIKFRFDKSNLEEKYERNFIRNNVIPLLKKLNPNLEETFVRNSFHFNQEAGIVKEFLNNKAVEYATQTHDALFINKTRLKHERYIESILHHLISGYGFNSSQQKNLVTCILENAEVGKIFLSRSHRLTVDRNDLVIKPRVIHKTELLVNSMAELKKLPFVKVASLRKFAIPSAKEFVFRPSQLIFPLTFRTRRTGDKFKPFGMKGFKLLSDFMKDEKLNSIEKENCLLLVNGNGEILWVIGYRSDERYRVQKDETNLMKITALD